MVCAVRCWQWERKETDACLELGHEKGGQQDDKISGWEDEHLLREWHVTIWRAECNEESPDWRSPETFKVGTKGWEHTLEQTLKFQ